MKLYAQLRIAIRRQQRGFRYHRIYNKFRDFTMIPEEIYIQNLMLAESVVGIGGCVVECGVWRGGMSAGIASILGSGRRYFLFDSFEGLPPAQDIDGAAALRWQSDKKSEFYYDNCAAPPELARQAMTLAGARDVHLMKGWFDKTLKDFAPPTQIALLRLDGDWYDSTMVCLDSLYDSVCAGGLIILDDYYTWDGCSRALHDFLSKRSAVERISDDGGVCFLRKRSAQVAATHS
jgi:O-methyltransferase